MRVIGFGLLTAGLFLCIPWAALGFFVMSFGLILLLIAEEKKKRAARLDRLEAARSSLHERTILHSEKPQEITVLEPPNLHTHAAHHRSYDVQKWNELKRDDPDLARVVEVLDCYGKKYVEQFARSYLVFEDKDFLPLIVSKIIAVAKKDSDFQNITGQPLFADDPSRATALARNPHLSKLDSFVANHAVLLADRKLVEAKQNKRSMPSGNLVAPEIDEERSKMEPIGRTAADARKSVRLVDGDEANLTALADRVHMKAAPKR